MDGCPSDSQLWLVCGFVVGPHNSTSHVSCSHDASFTWSSVTVVCHWLHSVVVSQLLKLYETIKLDIRIFFYLHFGYLTRCCPECWLLLLELWLLPPLNEPPYLICYCWIGYWFCWKYIWDYPIIVPWLFWFIGWPGLGGRLLLFGALHGRPEPALYWLEPIRFVLPEVDCRFWFSLSFTCWLLLDIFERFM